MNRHAKAAVTAAGLSFLFLIAYVSCNRLSAGRGDVGVAYMDWERHIPFLPWLIIPYMSIDLFFVAAPFICQDDHERRTLARRIAVAILTAAVFFLVMPLRFAFERPHVDGPMGLIFNNFREIDLPYNQFPSLHIALAMILVVHYARHSGGILRGLVSLWFFLVAISTIFTYQHHLIDLVGGAGLGLWVIYLFPGKVSDVSTTNYRVSAYYAIGTVVLIGLACVWRPWSLILLWPALSLATVALGYAAVGPAIYRKQGGRLPVAVMIFHAPMLLGQWLSWRHYARRSDAWNAVTDRVWLGRRLTESEARDAVARGVSAVLDLTSEFTEPLAFQALAYLQMPILDLTAPSPEQLAAAVAFIDRESAAGVVYVHCKVGYSRSGAVVAAWLVAAGQAETADAAIARLYDARRGLVLRPEAVAAVRSSATVSAGGGGAV